MVARTRGEFREAERFQFPAHGCRAERDPELFPDPSYKIEQPPPDHSINSRERAPFDNPHKFGPLRRVELRRRAGRLPAYQTLGAVCIQALDPVPDDLATDAACRSRLTPAAAIIDHRKRQQPTCLIRIPAFPRETSQLRTGEVIPKRQRSTHARLLALFDKEPEIGAKGNPVDESEMSQPRITLENRVLNKKRGREWERRGLSYLASPKLVIIGLVEGYHQSFKHTLEQIGVSMPPL